MATQSVPDEPKKPRRSDYMGEPSEGKPKQYIVWICERKGQFVLRRSGKRKEVEGCGGLNVVYTAKHWGWPSGSKEEAKSRAWQAKCKCGKRTRLGKQYCPPSRIYDTLEEARAFVRIEEIDRKRDELMNSVYMAEEHEKKTRKRILKVFCKKHNLRYPFVDGDGL